MKPIILSYIIQIDCIQFILNFCVYISIFLTRNPPYSKEIVFLLFNFYIISHVQDCIYVSLSAPAWLVKGN
jgi:hypothetical protein